MCQVLPICTRPALCQTRYEHRRLRCISSQRHCPLLEESRSPRYDFLLFYGTVPDLHTRHIRNLISFSSLQASWHNAKIPNSFFSTLSSSLLSILDRHDRLFSNLIEILVAQLLYQFGFFMPTALLFNSHSPHARMTGTGHQDLICRKAPPG